MNNGRFYVFNFNFSIIQDFYIESYDMYKLRMY
jgi:hypothetical protein